MLLVFYLGGRFILINIIHQAEKEITVVSNNIKSVITHQIKSLQDLTQSKAEGYASLSTAEFRSAFLKSCLHPNSRRVQTQIAAVLNLDGSLREGYYCLDEQAPAKIEPEMLNRYFGAESDLSKLLLDRQTASGVIDFQGISHYILISTIQGPTKKIESIFILGSVVHGNELYKKMTEISQGLSILLNEREPAESGSQNRVPKAFTKLAPIFKDNELFSAGGQWHVGSNDFEAVIPIYDIRGEEISSLSIKFPRSFSSLTTVALGYLTAFVALVGIFFIAPILWLQSRIILDPLSKLKRQIREISARYKENKIEYLNYKSNDEFGTVARSVDNLLQELNTQSEQVKCSAQCQKALITSIPDCLCIFSKSQVLLSIEKQPDDSKPIPGLEPNHQLSAEIFIDESLQIFQMALKSVFESNETKNSSLICREITGGLRYFETRMTRMDEHFALVVFRDVTADTIKYKEQEKLDTRASKVQQMSNMGNLAASIAHDFNTVMTIINNTLETMGTPSQSGSSGGEAVYTLKQATSKGTSLVKELMTYAGQTNTNMKQQNPNHLIMELTLLYKGLVPPSVTLEIDTSENLHDVIVDSDQFWKVIVNLVKNAAESIESSRGYIKISTHNFQLTQSNAMQFFSSHPLEPDQGVVFEVADNGAGIPQEIIDRLFEPFFSTKAVGRGLGLATVFGIVDSHNGGISITSQENVGTKFRVWLPAAPMENQSDIDTLADLQHDNEVGPQSAVETAAESSSGRSCVLIIDDDPSIIKTSALLLGKMGIETLTASTKNEAVARFRKYHKRINIVMLDAQIGNLDSVRLLAILRMTDENLPVVICSGHAKEKIEKMFKNSGINGILTKPYTMAELKSTLSKYITLLSK